MANNFGGLLFAAPCITVRKTNLILDNIFICLLPIFLQVKDSRLHYTKVFFHELHFSYYSNNNANEHAHLHLHKPSALNIKYIQWFAQKQKNNHAFHDYVFSLFHKFLRNIIILMITVLTRPKVIGW